MKAQPNKTERIHSLDSLRAIMMLLGLVLHAAVTYTITDWGKAWSLKDPNSTSLFNDYIAEIIHVFRMPIFFLVAGFFGAMLFYDRTPLKMVKNRIARIVYPFIVFVILLWPTIVFAWVYTRSSFDGSNNPLADALAPFSNILVIIPQSTFHLWFLYYLAMITFVSVGLGLLFRRLPKISYNISVVFGTIIQKPIFRIVVFACLSIVIYFIMGTSQVETSNSFIPNIDTFIFYLLFYLVGWVLFKSKQLLDSMMKLDWVCTLLGVAVFTIYFFMKDAFNDEVLIILKSITVWLLIFGITGLFIRYGSQHSAKMRYISDSSYWVYLVHLSIIGFIPSLIVDWPIHAIFKFIIVMTFTAVISFVSYHYLVRSSFIGKFLNGRKYSRKLSDLIKTEDVNSPILV